MKALALLAVFLTACAPVVAPTDPWPNPPSPYHDATTSAYRDCAGPYVSWGLSSFRTEWPRTHVVSETMRCINTGNIVGPYRYSVED